eukprot:4844318-Prymnesium_polylepis.2
MYHHPSGFECLRVVVATSGCWAGRCAGAAGMCAGASRAVARCGRWARCGACACRPWPPRSGK